MSKTNAQLTRINDDGQVAVVQHFDGDTRATISVGTVAIGAFMVFFGSENKISLSATGLRELAEELLTAAGRVELAQQKLNGFAGSASHVACKCAEPRAAIPIDSAAATGNDLGCADRPTPDAAYATTAEQNAVNPDLARDRQPEVEVRRDRERSASRSGVHVADERTSASAPGTAPTTAPTTAPARAGSNGSLNP